MAYTFTSTVMAYRRCMAGLAQQPQPDEYVDGIRARGSNHGDRKAWRAHGFFDEPEALTAKGSLPSAWAKNWRANPNDVVLCDHDTNVWMTNAELEAASATVARTFTNAGVKRGDRIVMSCEPSVSLIVAHVGALRMGAIVVPVNTAYGKTELQRIVNQCRPALAVFDDPSSITGVPTCDASVSLPATAHRDHTSEHQFELELELDNTRAEDPALLMFTSGTTGLPKGVVLSHGNILASAQALVTAWQWTANDRLLLALPLFHMHGLGVGVHGTLLAGASAVIVPKFSVDTVLDAIARHHATLFFGVPTMWVRMAASSRIAELAPLRLCVSGSAPLSPDTWRALADKGHQQILERYGMTETIMNISNPLVGQRRPGSVGLPLPGVSVRVRGVEGPGEIVLRGPNVLQTYWERPDATAEAFTSDGWFLTGDLGEIDTDGYIQIVGRSKDLIISGGFNVYPREVEEALLTHPHVSEAAVIGVAHPEWGETVMAFVVTDRLVSTDELHAHVEPLLAKYKRPREIKFLNELPKNALGKTQKHILVEMVSPE
jgi:malonyl-CoA/methylmalonyl-CoA synthetase